MGSLQVPGEAFLRACCDSAALPHLGEQTCLPKSGTACQASLSRGSAIAGCDSRGGQAGLEPISSISPLAAAALTVPSCQIMSMQGVFLLQLCQVNHSPTCCLPFVSLGQLRAPIRGYLFPAYAACRLGFPTGTGKHQCLQGNGNTYTQVWS